MRVATQELAAEFPMSGQIKCAQRRTELGRCLRIRQSSGRSKITKKGAALPLDAREKAQLLKNQAPGKYGKKQKKDEHEPGNPSGLGQKRTQLALEK
jgi:hypothetical protein